MSKYPPVACDPIYQTYGTNLEQYALGDFNVNEVAVSNGKSTSYAGYL